ncbi:hypothetical protein GCM10025783_12250 [Amnibacterium soli]|uniref:Uncharacterized protein n=1 Tax=Amnibacterium soli TaxID=1282736 RepID=A0ABP8YZP5_9MICO
MTTHWRSAFEKPRSAWAAGRAMFTTVASSTTISWARATTASVHQRREDGAAASGEAAGGAAEGEEVMAGSIYGTEQFRI